MTSRTVVSNQLGVHRNLEGIVGRHIRALWQKPISQHTQRSFDEVSEWLDDPHRPIIVDSCCGDGESTSVLSRQFPAARVIGIDKSAARLSGSNRHHATDNCLVVRGDVNDFWRLLVGEKWCVSQHFLLYPNPYPKAAQFRKRWHGSPALQVLVAMGGKLTVRSNWHTYIEEFCLALKVLEVSSSWQQIDIAAPMSAFERKYAASGHELWQLEARLPSRG